MAKIILIEPDKVLANTHNDYLISLGHETFISAGAQEAVFVADQFKPDLVIVELQLVEHSGIEFLYEFRSYKDWQTIPIIVLTQIPPSEFNESIELIKKDLNIDIFLYKPNTSLDKLQKCLNDILVKTA